MARRRADPRSVAYEVLAAVEERGAFADRALDAALGRPGAMSDQDRRLATELVYGVLRWRGTLDRCLEPVLRKPIDRLDPAVVRILRLGTYQVLFLDRVPDHAAVNESVGLARRYGPGGSWNLVNGALRTLCRKRNGGRGLPAAGDLSEAVDFPDWIRAIWTEELGPGRAHDLFAALRSPPQTVLRTNTRKTDRASLILRLAEEGYRAEPVEGVPEAVLLREGGDLRRSRCYQEGLCIQQDAASQLVVHLLDPRPGERVLDVCAAPGIKTTQIAERMDGLGRIVAIDRNRPRLLELTVIAKRMGASGVCPVCADASRTDLPLVGRLDFDRVLVDPPCSGLGILRRNPERKWRGPPDFDSLVRLQARLIRSGAARLRSGGILVYSTCTVHRQENEGVVERFLVENPGYVLEDIGPYLPGEFRDLCSGEGYFRSWERPRDFDLFFCARIRRL